MAPGEAEAATCAASPSTELLLFLSLLLLGGTVDKSSKQFHLFYVPLWRPTITINVDLILQTEIFVKLGILWEDIQKVDTQEM